MISIGEGERREKAHDRHTSARAQACGPKMLAKKPCVCKKKHQKGKVEGSWLGLGWKAG